MAIGYLLVDLPENCLNCKFQSSDLCLMFDDPHPVKSGSESRPEWCPIMTVPSGDPLIYDRQEIIKQCKNTILDSYIDAYRHGVDPFENDCVEEGASDRLRSLLSDEEWRQWCETNYEKWKIIYDVFGNAAAKAYPDEVLDKWKADHLEEIWYA